MRSQSLEALSAAMLTSGSAPSCSGFNLPWWGEAQIFLLVTPAGWAFLALAAAAVIALVTFAMKGGQGK